MAEVLQCDRDAAAALANSIGEPEIASNILAGTRDPYVWVQAFAAHREAAEKAARLEIGKLLEHICKTDSSDRIDYRYQVLSWDILENPSILPTVK